MSSGREDEAIHIGKGKKNGINVDMSLVIGATLTNISNIVDEN